MNIKVITQQQEVGLSKYKEYCKEYDLPIDDFWSWYFDWCYESGLYYDRVSYQ